MLQSSPRRCGARGPTRRRGYISSLQRLARSPPSKRSSDPTQHPTHLPTSLPTTSPTHRPEHDHPTKDVPLSRLSRLFGRCGPHSRCSRSLGAREEAMFRKPRRGGPAMHPGVCDQGRQELPERQVVQYTVSPSVLYGEGRTELDIEEISLHVSGLVPDLD
ncbi:hypothetical protein CALCODRAFT_247041 [Calocera cornea HHB12733]|uniref:Uncharacterized protein n=1 Tax=Calocera cornea HHB12733 TaxID=1353952 RepID=A0A165JUW6_9BASI|nr:hypothetical protein CALCODRAFT_247041 [Calocera cornea HHB12733]